MATSKSSWTKFERDVASTDWDSTRNPLSGANNRNDDGTPRGGDVIIPAGLSVLIECKYRAKHSHHSLFREAEEDGNFHKKKETILYTKVKREHGWLVVLNGDFFSKIRKLPGFDELIKDDGRTLPDNSEKEESEKGADIPGNETVTSKTRGNRKTSSTRTRRKTSK